MIDRRRTIALVLVAMLAFAGCSSGPVGPDTGADPVEDGSADGAAGLAGGAGGSTGTLAFYVSDRPTAIDEFASLEVTISTIGVRRAGGDGGADEARPGPSGDENASIPVDGTSNETTTASGNESDANATATATTSTETPANATATTAGPTEEADVEGSDGWVTHPVDGATVDLTELQGENATRIANLSLPAGEYDGVYLAISNVNGTLTTGERVRVKLPSERLRINKGFAIGPNRSTAFVFDVAVHRAGNSGKYVLQPVISQSGADVSFRDVGKGRERGESTQRGGPDDARGATSDVELRVELAGPVKAGREATVRVARDDEPVENATVFVDGEPIGRTGERGRLAVVVPDVDSLEVTVRADGEEATRSRRVR